MKPAWYEFLLWPAKTCSHCHTPLPRNADYFTPEKHHSDGLASECRECRRARQMGRYRRRIVNRSASGEVDNPAADIGDPEKVSQGQRCPRAARTAEGVAGNLA